jgi:hypothetical protein
VIAPVQKKRNKISMCRLDNYDDDDDNNNDNKDYYFETPKKRNNNASKGKYKKRKTTIIHDLVLGKEFGNEGTAKVDNRKEETTTRTMTMAQWGSHQRCMG